MKRKDRDEDIRERRENYERGMVRLENSLRKFRQFAAVDLTPMIDVSGRHMGEAPYLKITADQLDQIVTLMQGEFEVEAQTEQGATVLQFERKPVLSARRPGLVTS
jgi:hypothetical protein